MIPNKKSNTNGCNPLSSNCVVWQGPDLECIDLCAGDTISDVVAKIAHALCECCDPVLRSGQSRSASTSDISTIIQGCITINKGRDAQNLDELLQFIIDKICETDQTLSRSAAADPTAFATAYLMPLPQAAQFDQGSTRITEQVLYDKTTDSGWIITIGNYIGGLQDSVTSIQRTLENHEERIANIERSAGGTTIGGARAAASGSNTVRPTTVDANGNPIAGAGVDNNRQGPFFVTPAYFLYSDDVADLTNSVRSLFMRTNLSTSSILDSHIGGGFSNILTRVPIKSEPGGIINIDPVNGDVHKLLLKLKAITNIAIRLTNQKNETINLNGLDFDVSLKLEFIEDTNLKEPPNVRETLYEQSQKFAEQKALQIEEQEKKLKQIKSKKKKKNKS